MGQEKNIENGIKHLFTALGAYITKVQSGVVMQEWKGKKRFIHMAEKGTPDLIGCINGRFVAIEVKKDETEKRKWNAYPMGLRGEPVKHNGRIEAQKWRADQIDKAGGVFILACSIEDVERALMAEGILNSKYTLV